MKEMLHRINNQHLEVAISEVGAELRGIRSAQDGLEYLWQGNDDYPGNQSPLLFPITGSLANNEYQWEGRTYSMPQHGIVRSRVFQAAQTEEDAIGFHLHWDEETCAHYPFPFVLEVEYRLVNSALEVHYRVKNMGQGTMPFSIGGHTGFRCPLYPEKEGMEDYEVLFEGPETVRRRLIDNGLLTGEQELLVDGEDTLPLSIPLFQRRALVMDGLRSKTVVMRSKNHPRTLAVHYHGFPHLLLYSQPGLGKALYIEPWHGMTSLAGDTQTPFDKRESTLLLAPGNIFECRFSISCQ